jgi:hypothetical protein
LNLKPGIYLLSLERRRSCEATATEAQWVHVQRSGKDKPNRCYSDEHGSIARSDRYITLGIRNQALNHPDIKVAIWSRPYNTEAREKLEFINWSPPTMPSELPLGPDEDMGDLLPSKETSLSFTFNLEALALALEGPLISSGKSVKDPALAARGNMFLFITRALEEPLTRFG